MNWYEGWSSDDNFRKIADDRAIIKLKELVNIVRRLSGGEQDNCPADNYPLLRNVIMILQIQISIADTFTVSKFYPSGGTLKWLRASIFQRVNMELTIVKPPEDHDST